MKKKILLRSYVDGNMDCLYDYYNKNLKEKYKDEYKVIFHKHGGNKKISIYFNKIKEYFSKYHIFISDYTSTLYGKGKYNIYMSHGYGTKMTPGLDEIKKDEVMNVYKIMRENLDYIITLSKRDESYFLKSEWLNQYKEPKYLPLGLPRNDELFDKKNVEEKNKIFRKRFCKNNEKVILYCPTWRDYNIDKDIFTLENLKKLDAFLEKNNCKLFYRAHYLKSIIDIEILNEMNNIELLGFDKEPFIQNILCSADILITDYSSVFVDYLIINKPIIFFIFDLEVYKNSRGLVIDFNKNEDTPGKKVKNIEELILILEEYIKNSDLDNDIRKKAIDNFYKYKNSNSSKRIWDLILSLK